MKTVLLTLTAFYILTPVLTAPRRRQTVMALRENRRFRSCCFVDIFCFTVCFHSGDRTRNDFAAGERLHNIRHLNHKRRKFTSAEQTISVATEQIKGLKDTSPFDMSQQYETFTNEHHRGRHRHGERSKRSTSLLWNKLRFVQ